MKIALTLLLLTFTLSALANTFTVTTNADSGPGSLRDAITQAAANGTATADLIVFNIADQSRAGRTITLASMLPDLSSNLTIDATTQPGVPFGISSARVIITNPGSVTIVNYFTMIAVDNVRIYGFFLQGRAGYGFYFREATNLTFGAAGKGNIIQGCGVAVQCDYILASEPGSSNVTIQGNIMGTDESGTSVGYQQSLQNGFYLRNVSNLQIGGPNPGEGNLINIISIPMDYTDTRDIDFGYLNFQGNMVGTDITGNIRLSPNYESIDINGYNNGNASVTGTTRLALTITGNITACGYELFDIGSPFVIQGNHIGVGPDNTSNIINDGYNGFQDGIGLEFCSHGLIGGTGPGEMNYIANFIQSGVSEFWCGPITISRNSIFCNGYGIDFDAGTYPHPTPFANITLLTTGLVGGTALPGSIIELFYDDECPGCEGKTYIGTTTADNNGNWSYALTATGAIVATATDTYGGTSAFSKATINTTNVVVQNSTCGRNNGSIKNIEVTSGTEWYWKDAAGNIVANSVDLTNAAPGTYTFVTSIGGATCDATSTPYTITNVNLPALDPNALTLTQPSCGQNSGAIAYSGVLDPATNYSWLSAGVTICPDFSVANPLKQLAPGSYTLKLALKNDATCTAQYGPYTLANLAGPSVTATPAVTGTVCSKANGSITGITYQNATLPVYTAWRNEQGATISTTIDLLNAYAGKYQLVFKDGGSCDTIFSAWYTVPDNGTITYDTSGMVILPASCAAPTGSITGIVATNASVFTWTNTGDGSMVGNAADVPGLTGGTYQLTMSNSLGCQAQTPGLFVAQFPKPAFDYTGLQSKNDTCNAAIGSIQGLAMIDLNRTYTWSWYSTANPATPIAATSGKLVNQKAGGYTVTVTDQYSCAVTSKVLMIADAELSPPLPEVAGPYIPRNTQATLTVANPQTGEYRLFDGPSYSATILDSSDAGILHTPDIPQDVTLYIGFFRGDCASPLVPVNIKVFDSVRIYVPNAFTPNGDGANDRWHPVIQGLTRKMQVSVFDRWGTKVFSSNDPDVYWDGNFSGRPLMGTFVYMIAGIDYYNKPFLLKGTVIIIR